MPAWIKRHVRAVLLVLAGLSLVPAWLHAYNLTGASDIPTALLGDTLIVNHAAYSLKLPYSETQVFRTGAPRRGDLVLVRVLNNPRLKFPFFKRVVGLPGETVELTENHVVVNGRPLTVQALDPAAFTWVPAAHPIGSAVVSEEGHWITFTPGKGATRNCPPVALSEDQYFVLGDNRDNSLDSRDFGPVSRALLLGKVIAILKTGERRR